MKLHYLFFFIALISGLAMAAGGTVVSVILADNMTLKCHNNTVTITHVLTNKYSLNLETISIIDEIPKTANLKYISQPYTLTNGQISFLISALNPQESKTITYTYTLPAGDYSLHVSKNTYRMNFENHIQKPKTISFTSEKTSGTQTSSVLSAPSKQHFSEEVMGPAYATLVLGLLYWVIK